MASLQVIYETRLNYKYYHSWPYISHVMWTLPSKILLLRQTSICWGLVFTCLKIIPIKPTWVTWILFERRIKPTKKVQQFIQQRPTVIMQTFFFLFYITWHHSLNKNWRILPNPYWTNSQYILIRSLLSCRCVSSPNYRRRLVIFSRIQQARPTLVNI